MASERLVSLQIVHLQLLFVADGAEASHPCIVVVEQVGCVACMRVMTPCTGKFTPRSKGIRDTSCGMPHARKTLDHMRTAGLLLMAGEAVARRLDMSSEGLIRCMGVMADCAADQRGAVPEFLGSPDLHGLLMALYA